MSDNNPQLINVRTFRNEIKDILDGTRFLNCHYIVMNRGQAVAQVLPPDDNETAENLTVTDVRIRTRAVLQAVLKQSKTFLIVRHGRVEAMICPLQQKEYVA